jgi:hypothetical protein
VKPVLADQHEQRRPYPDQGVGAQPGVLAPQLALQADRRGQQQRQAQLAQLPPALAADRIRGGGDGREGEVHPCITPPSSDATARKPHVYAFSLTAKIRRTIRRAREVGQRLA